MIRRERRIWISILGATLLGALLMVPLPVCGQSSMAARPSEEPERFALLVGVSDYSQPSDKKYKINPLKGPPNDVELMKKLLVEYGFKDDQKHVLPLLGKKATHVGIASAFKTQLIDNAAKYPNAIFVFYFSGHGSRAYKVAPGDDSVHDTLVAYDSRSDGGKDILDNELIDWFEALRAYTSNVTFILDSCHSGSAIKDIGTLVSRELPPNPRQGAAAPSLASQGSSAKSGGYYIPRRQQFALLSGSLDYESSYEDEIQTKDGPRYHGFFTYYLVQTLWQNRDMSNERAVGDTARALAKVSPNQHPIAVGNTEGVVLQGAANREDPYVKMTEPSGDTFQIMAGAPLGIRKGAFLAIYAPSVKHLVGDEDKLADARVTEVGTSSSTAVLSGKPKAKLGADDKVVVVTPFFGFEKLSIRIKDLPNQVLSPRDREVLADVAEILKDNALVALAKGNDEWNVTIRRGCKVGDHLVVAAELPSLKPSCTDFTYYLTGAKGDNPLLGFWVPSGDPEAAKTIANKIVMKAKQDNVLALDNEVSSMRGQIEIKLIKVDVVKDAAGRPTVIPKSEPTNDGPQKLKIGENFQLQIKNNTNPAQDIYAAVFMLGTSGAVELATTNPNGDSIPAGKSFITHAPRIAGLPAGLETYKVFATTSSGVDYRVLEQSSLASKDAVGSPFEWLLNQTSNTKVRDDSASAADWADWATAAINIVVEP
jgi:hypothetical protein